MAIPITIPRLGWNMEEGVFVGWLKPDGVTLRAGDALFTLESDKATENVECLDDGILQLLPNGPQAGDTVAVGAVIGYVVQAGEQTTPSTNATGRKPTSSPRARRVARELGIDWTTLQGSGRTGRIRERDVRVAAASAVAALG